MDLSQQELPLTAYFARGSKESRHRVVSHKKGKPTEDSQSVARPSKRRKSSAQCFATSASASPADQSNSRTETLQLPTPATSTKKRTRSGRLKLPAKTPLTTTDASPPSRQGVQGAVSGISPLATPSSGRRRTSRSGGIEFHPDPRGSSRGKTCIATPRSLPRKMAELEHDVDNHSPPLARSDRHLPKLGQASLRLPDSVLPAQGLDRLTVGLSCFPVDSACMDPFNTRDKIAISVHPGSAFAQAPERSSIQSDGQAPSGHALPMLPIPSSQSQYLLPLDATPKRKRCSPRIDRVMSSQTQEEQELTMSTPHRSAPSVRALARVSPIKDTHGSTQLARPSYSERKSQHTHTLNSTPMVSPNGSPVSPCRSFFATRKEVNELSSPSRRNSYYLSRKTKTPRKSPRRNSVENIPPSYIEDSLTESESDSDILGMTMKDKLPALGVSPQEMNQALHHSPAGRDAGLPVSRGSAESDLLGVKDDSATEAESDTEILHCVAEIGRKRPRQVSREDTPRPQVISPLVSPTRPRIAHMPSITSSAQSLTQGESGLSIPGSDPSHPSAMARRMIPSESLPSVVRDFICMFPGDESYPADFPESLRV